MNQYEKRNYPKTKSFFEDTITSCEKNGYVETIFWRKRYIASINDRNSIIKKSAEREAINMPIQWTSADIIKIAMILVDRFLKESKLKTKMIMQVHDELVFDVFPWEEEILKKEVIKIMQDVIKGEKINLKKENLIELKVDLWIGNTWRDAK